MRKEIVLIHRRMPPNKLAQCVLSTGNLPVVGSALTRILRFSLCLTVLFAACIASICNGQSANAAAAEQAYQAAKSAWEAHGTNLELGWHFARACYNRADVAANDTERINIAREGIAAARHVIMHDPQIAAAHYYLGMNLGQVAMIKRMAALRMVDEMEAEFEKARLLDEKFDYAGADRCLGLLYRDAPGWPLSIGNKSKSRQFLVRAVEVEPSSPENQLILIESYIKWGDWSKAAQQALKYQALIPEAKKRFAGADFQHDWTDWDQRWEAIQLKLDHKDTGWRKQK